LARWTAFGTDSVSVESVLRTKLAGAYTARAIPFNAGRIVFSHSSEVTDVVDAELDSPAVGSGVDGAPSTPGVAA